MTDVVDQPRPRGAERRAAAAPARIGLWRHLLVALVAGLGCLYAAPNLFTPDFALQVTADNAERPVDAAFLTELEGVLAGGGVEAIGS